MHLHFAVLAGLGMLEQGIDIPFLLSFSILVYNMRLMVPTAATGGYMKDLAQGLVGELTGYL